VSAPLIRFQKRWRRWENSSKRKLKIGPSRRRRVNFAKATEDPDEVASQWIFNFLIG